MAARKISNNVLQWLKGKTSFKEDNDHPGSHSRESGSSTQSRILDIERAERAERAMLTERAERLCNSQTAHNNAVLERMGLSIQHNTLPSPQPPASPRRSPESSLQGGRIRPKLHLPPLNVEESNSGRTPRTNQTKLDKEDPFFEKKLHLGRRPSRLPLMTGKLGGAGKEVADGCMLRSAKTKVENLMERMEQFQLAHFPSPQPPAAPRRNPAAPRGKPAVLTTTPSAPRGKPAVLTTTPSAPRGKPAVLTTTPSAPRGKPAVLTTTPSAPRGKPAVLTRTPAAVPRRTTAVTPMVPTPPSIAPPTKGREPRRGINLRPPKADNGRDDLQPLGNSSKSLSLFFTLMMSDDWEKKVEGFKSFRALARHHPEVLQTKLHEVCLILTEEVTNLRSVVACAAIDAIAELHVNLGRDMDPEADRTGRALLLKLAQTTNAFIHQQTNLALDALVEGCSPYRVMSALLNTGLSHRCAAVRGSTAQHLHQLADIVGEDQILTAGKIFAERFLTAVSKMSVDAAPDVRHHGQEMLHGLASQNEFMVLWGKLIPVKDRHPLQKILKKTSQ